jgi:hypothetical protein
MVVTAMGQTGAPLHEVTVEADNWMSALRAGRARIGESGGVPTGASCAVAPDGKVSVLDPVSRRSYVLTPDTSQSMRPAPPPAGPRVPLDEVPRTAPAAPVPTAIDAVKGGSVPDATSERSESPAPQPVPGAGDAPSSAPQGVTKVRHDTVAYVMPAELQAKLAAAQQVVAVGTVAGSPPAAAAGPAGSGVAPPTPEASATASASTLATWATQSPGATARPPSSRPAPAMPAAENQAAPMPSGSLAQATPASPPAGPPDRKALSRTMAYSAPNVFSSVSPKVVAVGTPVEPRTADAASAPTPATPSASDTPPTPDTPPASEASSSPSAPTSPASAHWPPSHSAPTSEGSPQAAVPVAQGEAPAVRGTLHLSRDEEPSADSPLVYRERVYVVAEGTAPEEALAFVRSEFEAVARALEGRPPGKFVNLAVFDHAWTGRPARPPVVTLQWKDWRGAPEVSFPLRDRSAPPTGATAAGVAGPPATPSTPSTLAAAPPGRAPVAPHPSAPAPATAADDIRSPARARTATPVPSSQDDRLAQAFEACQDLFFLQSSAEGLEFVVRLLGDVVPSEASAAAIYDINTDEWRFVAVEGPGAEARKGDAVPASAGLSGLAARRDEPSIVDAVESDARFDPGVDGRVDMQVHNLLLQPVFHEGRLLGLLQLMNRRGKPHFDRADAHVVSYVARQLGQFLYQQRTLDRSPPRGTSVAHRRK